MFLAKAMDGETMQKSFDDILKGEGPKKDFEITKEVGFTLDPPRLYVPALFEKSTHT